MKTRFHAVFGSRWGNRGFAARASWMGLNARRFMAVIAVVAGSLTGCGNPGADEAGPDNARLPRGSEAVLYVPNAPTVDFLIVTHNGAGGASVQTLVMVPVGTRVRVEDDSLTDLVKDRSVQVTILEGEHEGHGETFRRSELRPATEPWTRRPGPAPGTPTPVSTSEEPASETSTAPAPPGGAAPAPPTPPVPSEEPRPGPPTTPRAERTDGPPSPGAAPDGL